MSNKSQSMSLRAIVGKNQSQQQQADAKDTAMGILANRYRQANPGKLFTVEDDVRSAGPQTDEHIYTIAPRDEA